MKFSYEQETDLPPSAIWEYYADVNKWFVWEGDLEKISLEGDFVNGTKGQMKLAGQPAMDFILESVIKDKEFTDCTPIPGMGDVYFAHCIKQSEGKTIIAHSVEFVPEGRKPNAEDLSFVSGIFSDVPESIFALEKAAKSNG